MAAAPCRLLHQRQGREEKEVYETPELKKEGDLKDITAGDTNGPSE